MENYKDRFIFKFERDISGKIYNRLDAYLSCRSKGKIWRYNSDILVFESPRKIRIKSENKETGEVFWDYTPLIIRVEDTEAERLIYFKEENIDKLEELFKIKRRKQLSEEQREQARIRMQEMWSKRNSEGAEITEEDLEESLDDYLELDSNEDIEVDE